MIRAVVGVLVPVKLVVMPDLRIELLCLADVDILQVLDGLLQAL